MRSTNRLRKPWLNGCCWQDSRLDDSPMMRGPHLRHVFVFVAKVGYKQLQSFIAFYSCKPGAAVSGQDLEPPQNLVLVQKNRLDRRLKQPRHLESQRKARVELAGLDGIDGLTVLPGLSRHRNPIALPSTRGLHGFSRQCGDRHAPARSCARGAVSSFADSGGAARSGQIHAGADAGQGSKLPPTDRKSTRLKASHANISYAVFCL